MSDKKSARVRKQPERLEVGEPKAKKARSTGEKKTTKKATGGAKKGGKKEGPKRPRTAYLFFSTEQRATVKAANPDATFGDLGKLLAEKWKKLSASDKKKYEDMAKKDKARYEKERDAASKE